MNGPPAAPPEVTRFLREYPPFDSLAADALDRVAAEIEVEFHRAGTTIFSQGADPVQHLRVVRAGSVEIVYDGRVLDLLSDGELFGHASMLSGLPTGFEARAAEDTLCYRIGADSARELLAAPAGLRYVTRSLLDEWAEGTASAEYAPPDPAYQPVASLIRDPAVICTPDTTIRRAARLMASAPATSVVVQLNDGTLGILTDRDLRTRVVAAGLGGDEPVSAAMSAPAYTCSPDRLGGDVLLEMLDRGFRHFPVVAATGEVLGVVEDLDVVAVQMRSSFFVRQRIAQAENVDELAEASRDLRPMVLAMHDARVAPENIMARYAVVLDALTRRLVELTIDELGEPPAPFAWLALGSQARRETTPSSDADSAIVWFGDIEEAAVRPQLHALGERVVDGLERCGLRRDAHGASASNRLFVRSLASWQRAAHSLIDDPMQDKALILVSVLLDSRPVWGVHMGTPVTDTFKLASRNPALSRLLARYALSYRPPTGFFRGLVVEHSGEHRGHLDLKHGGLIPIVDLARWAGMIAGVTCASTPERLRAGAAAGALSAVDAQTLTDAFELVSRLRVAHQVRQLQAGLEPDDFVDPVTLSLLTRSHLKESFRAVAAIQKRITQELNLGVA